MDKTVHGLIGRYHIVHTVHHGVSHGFHGVRELTGNGIGGGEGNVGHGGNRYLSFCKKEQDAIQDKENDRQYHNGRRIDLQTLLPRT